MPSTKADSEEFIHIFTSTSPPPPPPQFNPDVSRPSKPHPVTIAFSVNNSSPRVSTEIYIATALKRNYPHHHLTITNGYYDFINYTTSNKNCTYKPHIPPSEILSERTFIPPARRYGDESGGSFDDHVVFGGYEFTFQGEEFIVFIIDGGDGAMYKSRFTYILSPLSPSSSSSTSSTSSLNNEEQITKATDKTNEFIKVVANWMQELHNEVLVFDNSFWQKNKELWLNVQKARWEDVILEKGRKEMIIEDVVGFFDAEKRYKEFGVPWKRGVIFYGPPGNGKTISTKALMHDISLRTSPTISSLYVKTFNTYQGPEYGIRQIFLMARKMAPCLLIFEDIDSLVSPMVRSYFLNEVDGLESNHGILMIGSTNHLERLDPGIAKRPSRFDRKYLFDDPNRGERVLYAEYWRNKLKSNKNVEFPEIMCEKVADITDGFSFAYMKEAFVAALLSIVRNGKKRGAAGGGDEDGDDLKGNILWTELKKQIENLRKEMEGEDGDAIASNPPVVESTGSSRGSNFRRPYVEDEVTMRRNPREEARMDMRSIWPSLPLEDRRSRTLDPYRHFTQDLLYDSSDYEPLHEMGMPRYF